MDEKCAEKRVLIQASPVNGVYETYKHLVNTHGGWTDGMDCDLETKKWLWWCYLPQTAVDAFVRDASNAGLIVQFTIN